MGYAVHTAGDGTAGLALCHELEPRLVIVDVALPVMDGLEFLATLRRCEVPALRDLPVVMLSARVQACDVRAGICAGATEYVTKPFSPAALARSWAGSSTRRCSEVLQDRSRSAACWSTVACTRWRTPGSSAPRSGWNTQVTPP